MNIEDFIEEEYAIGQKITVSDNGLTFSAIIEHITNDFDMVIRTDKGNYPYTELTRAEVDELFPGEISGKRVHVDKCFAIIPGPNRTIEDVLNDYFIYEDKEDEIGSQDEEIYSKVNVSDTSLENQGTQEINEKDDTFITPQMRIYDENRRSPLLQYLSQRLNDVITDIVYHFCMGHRSQSKTILAREQKIVKENNISLKKYMKITSFGLVGHYYGKKHKELCFQILLRIICNDEIQEVFEREYKRAYENWTDYRSRLSSVVREKW